MPSLEILFEDNHCLAVAKPAGVLSTHFQGKEETLDRAVKKYLKRKYNKPGNVFLGVVQRLDRPVSGVLLFARTSKAASRLAEQFREGKVEKTYWAIVEGEVDQARGRLEDRLRKDESRHRVEVVTSAVDARHATLEFERKRSGKGVTWLELHPHTGRRHQLRVQLASRGHPIYGDAKYGSRHEFGGNIALHARCLTFLHPVRNEPVTLTAHVPSAWRERFAELLRGQGE